VKTLNKGIMLVVLDLVSQVRDVVLMNVYLDLGDPGGSGFWNERYMGKGKEIGRSDYEQPGNFQVSKGKLKGSKREWKKEKQKAMGIALRLHRIQYIHVHNECL
jgi:hypothetical protein